MNRDRLAKEEAAQSCRPCCLSHSEGHKTGDRGHNIRTEEILVHFFHQEPTCSAEPTFADVGVEIQVLLVAEWIWRHESPAPILKAFERTNQVLVAVLVAVYARVSRLWMQRGSD